MANQFSWVVPVGLLLFLVSSQSCAHKFGTDCGAHQSCAEDLAGGSGNGGNSGDGGGTSGGTGGADMCDPPCGGAAPVCDDETEKCVECVDEDDCDEGVCDTETKTCVGCLESSDCPAENPVCTDNSCTGCSGNDDCAEHPTTPFCDTESNGCVECLTEQDCPDGDDFNVCAPSTKTCTEVTARSKNACRSCTYDAECQEGQLCVEMSYPTPTPGTVGAFCLWRRDATAVGAPNGACGLGSQPYARSASITSVDGEEAIVCELRTTTCIALLQHGTAAEECTEPGNDTACGASGFNDGRCRHNNDIDQEAFCTYPCLGNQDCWAGSTCPEDGDRYCSL